MYFHEEERQTLDVLDSYERLHPCSHYLMEFAEGDLYECTFLDEAEDDNGEDLDSPDYDEFWTAYYTVLKVIMPGPNNPSKCHVLNLNYRHFPVRITTVDGALVYP